MLIVALFKECVHNLGPAEVSNIKCISKTVYFLFLHVLTLIDRVPLHRHSSPYQLADYVFWACLIDINYLGREILKAVSQSELLPLLYKLASPFLVYVQILSKFLFNMMDLLTSIHRYRARNRRAEEMLCKIYEHIDQTEFICHCDLLKSWLPRKFEGTIQSILAIPFRFTLAHAHRMLNSISQLIQEAQFELNLNCSYQCVDLIAIWRHMFYLGEKCSWTAHTWNGLLHLNPTLSAMVEELIATAEDPLHPQKIEEFLGICVRYKEQCEMRRRWGEYLRCNMDWEWDTGSCLKRLFKIETPLSPNSIDLEIAEGNSRDRDILQVKIGGARMTMPEGIQVPYKDEFGRIRYKTFYPGPSNEDFTHFAEEMEQPASQEPSKPLAPTCSSPKRTTKRMRVEHETGTGNMSYRAVYAGQSLEDITFAPNASCDSVLDRPRKREHCEIIQGGEDGPLVSASYDSESDESSNQVTSPAIVQGVGNDSMDVDSLESENFQEHVSESPSGSNCDVKYDNFVMDIQEAREQDHGAALEKAFKDMQYRDADELSYADSTMTYHTALSYPSYEENL